MTSIPKLLKLKDYITLSGTTMGLLALICAVIGNRSFLSLGFFFVAISLGTDLLDGYVARKTGTVNKFGIELDSLSDSLTFGIAPSVLAFQAFKTGSFYDIILIIGCICFALGAILRLARFNITTEDTPGYVGVPTPLSALLLIVFYCANYFYAFALGGIEHPFPEVSLYLIPFLMILIGWFNITTHIRFGEKDKKVYIIVLILAPLGTIFAIIGAMNPDFTVSMIMSIISLGGFFLLLIFIISGFFNKFEQTKESN
ncbi:MAG: CDP-diacylglycerol--serine O-phosphatidyltransferase [Promethearchaeota archaeon]